jgi:hypothetical protein
MAFAVVLQVDLSGGAREEGMKMLNELVIPHVKSQPGFVRGAWMNKSGNDGMAVVVFDTEDHARGAVDPMKPPPGGPTLRSIEVYEVFAEA